MAEHTPGPWRWMTPDALVADHGRRRAVLTSTGVLETCGEDGRLRAIDTVEPNARLIAAAPELLAAARLAVDVIGNTRDEFGLKLEAEKAYLALRAAIAKAERR